MTFVLPWKLVNTLTLDLRILFRNVITPLGNSQRWPCCNLSVGVVLNLRFTTNGMCVKSNTHIYVARTSNNRMIMVCDLYCCLLPQCEALHTRCSGFPIATTQRVHSRKFTNVTQVLTFRSIRGTDQGRFLTLVAIVKRWEHW